MRSTLIAALAVVGMTLAVLPALAADISAPIGSDEPPAELPVIATDQLAPVSRAEGGEGVADRWIVVHAKDVAAGAEASAASKVMALGGTLHHTYRTAISGFSATLSAQAVELLRADPSVSYIEQDSMVRLDATQAGATWGLDRIDQQNLPLDTTYTYDTDGTGVHVYIVDTGIRSTHNEFTGRVGNGMDYVDNDTNPSDCNGHGTHVASTTAGTTYGVAKAATVHAVRVLDCNGSGYNSDVIAGVDWVAANHTSPAVANMSLGGGASTALDNAVNGAVQGGVTFAVAAGNSNTNACTQSPARAAQAITVGSTTSSDARSSFSNYGSCLDVFAPGSSITAAWYQSNTQTNTISGTSMASPHVAGIAALYLDAHPSATPAAVGSAISSGATSGKVSSAGSGSPNLLAYSRLASGGPGPDPDPDPEPEPEPGCSYPETFSGTLSGSSDYDYHPDGTYYYSSAGVHHACMQGAAGTDFDLYLIRWNGSRWVTVAASTSASSTEQISYSGSSGYYAWQILSYSGSGDYAFQLDRP